MLDRAHITGRVAPAVGGVDGRDGGLFQAYPAPLDEHPPSLRLAAGRATIV